MNTRIENSICDAIEILCEKAISNAKFDKTIQATIVSCEDKKRGKYKLKFQDSLFYAFSTNINDEYKKGDQVYVLIPSNDMSKDKSIIGLVGEAIVHEDDTVIETAPSYEPVGNNIIDQQFFEEVELVPTVSLSSYYPEGYKETVNGPDLSKIMLYGGGDDRVTLINSQLIKHYISSSDYIKISAHVDVDIPDKHDLINGTFGVKLVLEYTNSQNQTVLKECNLSRTQMIGRPNRINSIQTGYFMLGVKDDEKFVRVHSIEFYEKDYVDSFVEPEPGFELYNITISNLVIQGARSIEKVLTNGTGIFLNFPKGSAFFVNKNNITNTFTIEPNNLIIKPNVYINQELVSNKNVKYYYGYRDVKVGLTSKDYYQNMGQNWRTFNEVDEEGFRIPSDEEFIITQAMCPAYENHFKVVAEYNGYILYREFTIYNFSERKIILTTSDGSNTYTKVKNKNIICTIYAYNPDTGEYEEEEDLTGYKFMWGYTPESTNMVLVENNYTNSLTDFDAEALLGRYGAIDCSVYSTNETKFYGTARLNLQHIDIVEDFNIILRNAERVFYYGNSGQIYEKYRTPQPITFEMYNSAGYQITDFNGWIITWKKPEGDTMLEVLDDVDSGDIITELHYKPKTYYDQNCDDNTITLELMNLESNKTYRLETKFIFIKEGDPGTNGTEYICKIVPNVDELDAYNKSVQFIIENSDTSRGFFKFNPGHYYNNQENQIKPFKIIITRQGVLIYDSSTAVNNTIIDGETQEQISVEIEWEVLLTKFNTTYQDYSNFEIDRTTGKLKYAPINSAEISTASGRDLTNSPSNIIHATVTLRKSGLSKEAATPICIIHDLMPIITVHYNSTEDYETLNFGLKDNTGFDKVVYASDGSSPSYNDEAFEIEYPEIVKNNVEGTWTVKGEVFNFSDLNPGYYKTKNIYIKEDVTGGTPAYIVHAKPNNYYNGLCVNNALYYSGTFGTVHIPIILYVNRYNFDNLNVWTGNGVLIDEDGGYILANQICAGHKEDDNSFTGVVMGDVHEGGKSFRETGLFGYNYGKRSFFVDAESGYTQFGDGIVFDPKAEVLDPVTSAPLYSVNNLIYSKSFWASTNYNAKGKPNNYRYKLRTGEFNSDPSVTSGLKGLLINLDEGDIFYGSGNFYINSDGELFSKRGSIGGWTISPSALYSPVTKEGWSDIPENADTALYSNGLIKTKNLQAKGGFIGKITITESGLVADGSRSVFLIQDLPPNSSETVVFSPRNYGMTMSTGVSAITLTAYAGSLNYGEQPGKIRVKVYRGTGINSSTTPWKEEVVEYPNPFTFTIYNGEYSEYYAGQNSMLFNSATITVILENISENVSSNGKEPKASLRFDISTLTLTNVGSFGTHGGIFSGEVYSGIGRINGIEYDYDYKKDDLPLFTYGDNTGYYGNHYEASFKGITGPRFDFNWGQTELNFEGYNSDGVVFNLKNSYGSGKIRMIAKSGTGQSNIERDYDNDIALGGAGPDHPIWESNFTISPDDGYDHSNASLATNHFLIYYE